MNHQWQTEIWRKSIHLSGIFFLPILFWNREFFVFLLLIFLTSYLLVEWAHRKGIRVPLLSALTEKSKRVGEEGKLVKGPIFLVLAGMVAPYLFGIIPAAIGLAQLFVADVASTLVGMKWGKKKIPYSKGKSWIGSLAFFISATFVSSFFVPLPQAIFLGFVGAVVESLPFPEADNLTVPFIVGLSASLLI